ncbi:major paralogous domain-containing protein [Fibrobacter sp. UWOV1]|uniref:FISUMP domain-containing protein n=1 Tax=Fibrobacter sp. UWOV1 TaxID=1896215 RepID=UPI000920EAAF|nr:FISUMP domain-containing protein [Fibrobacter sp. UWOV1]SHK30941.1 major paralogous domain-containing protein [Fibrobacter sp. UWOV1]
MKIFTLRHSWPVILEAKRRESILLAMALVFAVFTACDSGSSSTDPDPIAEVSSSSGDDAISSSSVTDKGTSSGGSSKSSSSEKSGNDSQKSSSSVSGKNSSSSEDESSSSEGCPFNGRNEDGSANLTVNCCNGDTAIVMSGKYTQYYTCRDDFWLRDSIGGQDTVKPYISHPNMEKQFASNVDYETFVDERDGQEYKVVTITIDNGLAKTRTFFAENLNYGKQILANAAEFSDSLVEKVCYNDDEWFCDNGFGGLYSWSEAMNLPKKYDTIAVEKLDTTYFNGNHYIQGICPKGWHIMEEDEWRLIGGGYKINSRAVWGGSDYYGFSLLPAGYSFQGKFYAYPKRAHIWLPELSKKRDDLGKGVVLYDDGIDYDKGLERYGYQPIRCTKDY